MNRPGSVSSAEVMTVACPQCGARPQVGCVYVPTKDASPYGSKSQREQAPRVGQPTKAPHQRRREAAWRLRARVAEHTPLVSIPATPAVVKAAQALYRFDLLGEWLRRHGNLLIDLEKDTPE